MPATALNTGIIAMFAAVDLKAKTVWGIGFNTADAIADAEKEIKGKPKFMRSNISLDCFPLAGDAPLEQDGDTLFKYCLFEATEDSAQIELF